jgi:aminopeptidase
MSPERDDYPGPHLESYPDAALVRGDAEREVDPEDRRELRARRTAQLASVIVELAANVQPDQVVGITLESGMEPLMLAVAQACYERGARFVDPWTFYPEVKRARLRHAPQESLGFVPPWLGERLLALAELRGCLIRLTAGSRTQMDGVDPARLGVDMLPRLRESQQMIASGRTNWTVVPCPSAGWAAAVYPAMDPERALDRLWDEIALICRLDEPDPAASWQARFDRLQQICDRLGELALDAIRFSGPGTELEVGLLPSSAWAAARARRDDGLPYVSNLPTEEVFTAPDPARVDGTVSSTKPLVVGGGLVEGLVVRFEAGRAVAVEAARGVELVRSMIATDAGAARLGELALVDRDSRVGQSGTVFYETLLDENAASHLAFGRAYQHSVTDQADRQRLNDSAIHIDFMIGSSEVEVTGVRRDGSAVPLLRAGTWQI